MACRHCGSDLHHPDCPKSYKDMLERLFAAAMFQLGFQAARGNTIGPPSDDHSYQLGFKRGKLTLVS